MPKGPGVPSRGFSSRHCEGAQHVVQRDTQTVPWPGVRAWGTTMTWMSSAAQPMAMSPWAPSGLSRTGLQGLFVSSP